jgi:hypothetical protein
LALPALSWNGAGAIRLIPSMSSGRFDPSDPRYAASAKLASGRGDGGFRLCKQEKADLEEDAKPRIRTSKYLRRTKRGTFFRVGF